MKGFVSVKTSVEQLESGQVKLAVTIGADKVDAAVKKAYKTVANQVKIPGFRPGKAPRNVIDSTVGREYILSEATEDLVNGTYVQALDEAGLRPVGKLDFDDIEDPVVEGQEFTYALTMNPRPQLTLTSTDVEIKMVSRDATPQEVQDQIDMTRDRFASLEPVEARPVAVGDFVSISFTSTLDGQDYEGSKLDSYLYETGKSMMPEEFESAIIGASPGDKVVAEFVVEDTGSNSEFAGKTLHFDIEINEIKEKNLPEVNDDFASMVGFNSVEEMEAEIRSYIQSQKDGSYERIRDERLVSALSDLIDGEVPAELILTRRESLMRDFEDRLKQNDLDMRTYFQNTGIDPEQFEKDMTIQAQITVSQDLALEALAREKGLEATDEDLEAEYAEIAEQFKISVDDAKAQWAEYGLKTTLFDQVSRRKSIEWLRENATITIDETAI